jgi:fructosamine-3-kinase
MTNAIRIENYRHLFRAHPGLSEVRLLNIFPVGGGSINVSYKLETDKGIFFLKENAGKFPGMFEAETKGLVILKNANAFVVPDVIFCQSDDSTSILILEWLEHGIPKKDAWLEAGKKLALLHKNFSDAFGLDHGNYIGSLAQSNEKHKTWEEFFSHERILPQLKLARDGRKIDAAICNAAERFCKMIPEIFPKEKPSLLHGDLWSGNFFFSTNGPAIFDPAVYFGHREMDLAMTKLFGGFDADFYSGYEEEFPLEKKWKSRIDFCNLYPLLVHVNLFGGGYVNDVKQVLEKF